MPRLPRLVKAVLLGPLALAAIVFVAVLLEYGPHTHRAGDEWFSLVLLVTAAALLAANLCVLLLGIPYYLCLKKYGLVSLRALLLGGFAMGGAGGVLAGAHFRHAAPMVLGEGAVLGLCGAGVAFVVWWAGLRGEAPRE